MTDTKEDIARYDNPQYTHYDCGGRVSISDERDVGLSSRYVVCHKCDEEGELDIEESYY